MRVGCPARRPPNPVTRRYGSTPHGAGAAGVGGSVRDESRERTLHDSEHRLRHRPVAGGARGHSVRRRPHRTPERPADAVARPRCRRLVGDAELAVPLVDRRHLRPGIPPRGGRAADVGDAGGHRPVRRDRPHRGRSCAGAHLRGCGGGGRRLDRAGDARPGGEPRSAAGQRLARHDPGHLPPGRGGSARRKRGDARWTASASSAGSVGRTTPDLPASLLAWPARWTCRSRSPTSRRARTPSSRAAPSPPSRWRLRRSRASGLSSRGVPRSLGRRTRCGRSRSRARGGAHAGRRPR